jgi:hypothetical protein
MAKLNKMKPITVTLTEIKEIKKLMDEVDSLKDRSLVIDGYSENYGNKNLIIKDKEKKITKNVKIISKLINVNFDIVINMCYDFEFAKIILKQFYI